MFVIYKIWKWLYLKKNTDNEKNSSSGNPKKKRFDFLKYLQRETMESAQACQTYMSGGGELRMYLESPLESKPQLDVFAWWHSMR
jgi:hypothetical protein